MNRPTFWEVCIVWPIRDYLFSLKLKAFKSVLIEHGMDWGEYPLEEIFKMYHAHKDEINLV